MAWRGVIRAAQKYDVTVTGFEGKTCSFPTYARKSIFNFIMRECQNRTHGKRRPENSFLISGSSPVGEDGGMTVLDMIGDPKTVSVDERDRVAVLSKRLNDVLKCVPERYRSIFKTLHGLDDDNPKTLEETADLFGVTRERTRQLAGDAMSQIRERLGVEDAA